MTTNNQQEQLYSEDVLRAGISAGLQVGSSPNYKFDNREQEIENILNSKWFKKSLPEQSVEDGKQGGEVGMSVEDVLADIILIRNKLHEDLPTGEMNAFELLQTIKWHINELDNYCTTLSTPKSQPSTPVQDGKDKK